MSKIKQFPYSFLLQVIDKNSARVYSELHSEEPAISLFIKKLKSADAGLYKCTSIYAANHELSASVSVSIISELNETSF